MPADLHGGLADSMALAHLSSSSSEGEGVNKQRKFHRKKTNAKKAKKANRPKKTLLDKRMEELDFVTKNWKPLKGNIR